ncbi:MAG: alpha/beta hydrolase [Bacteroidota bacterium]
MRQRPWYRRKRVLLLAFVLLLFGLSRLEVLRFRYQETELQSYLERQTERTVRFGRTSPEERGIQYLQVGQRDSLPLVVFVHGSPGSLDAYRHYLEQPQLLARANLLAADRPGFGHSDFGRAEPSLARQAERIAAILQDWPGVPKVLVGHSMGGPVISKMAMLYPDLVDGLVMVAPSISPYLEPSNTWRKVLDWIPLRWLTPPALRVCNQEIIPLREELDWMMSDWAALQIPVTVVQGSEDVLVPAGNADFAERMLPDGPVQIRMIEGGDHFILWSELPVVVAEILGVLEQLGPTEH